MKKLIKIKNLKKIAKKMYKKISPNKKIKKIN